MINEFYIPFFKGSFKITIRNGVVVSNIYIPSVNTSKYDSQNYIISKLLRYFKGEYVDFRNIPVDLTTLTDFERKVLTVLRDKVTWGYVKTYSWLAKEIGYPKAYRAVARALSKNPILIIIPCHRIIRANGDLGGFKSGGIDLKRELLRLEGFEASESLP